MKSIITDNEGAKLVSSHGVIQGYNGIAIVDEQRQIVVDAQAFGDGHEAAHVTEIIESIKKTFVAIDPDTWIFDSEVLTADTFVFNEEGVLICPAGNPMKSSCPNWEDKKGYTGRAFKGYSIYCRSCTVRTQCLPNPDSPARQVTKAA